MKFYLIKIYTYANKIKLLAQRSIVYTYANKIKLLVQCSIYDAQMNHKHLNWSRNPGQYWPLSSALIFQYHKLEKGLCLPAESRRYFGDSAALETCRLIHEMEQSGNQFDNRILKAAIETLRVWQLEMLRQKIQSENFLNLSHQIDDILKRYENDISLKTPIPFSKSDPCSADYFQLLMKRRRSTRNFDGKPVDFSLIKRATEIAQLSPSACNRQPWRLHFYDDPTAIQVMLKLQNGNAGFGHTIPLLAVVTSDRSSFFDLSERSEPDFDGGLFTMSFLLALQSLGLSSCCLNWCVFPELDRQGHLIGHIPQNEKILTFLAIGYARSDAYVPLSARRPIEDVVCKH